MSATRKKVLCPIQTKAGRTIWRNIGAAFVNRDGSWNVHLDAYPTNGKLQIRDLDERDMPKSKDAGAEGDGSLARQPQTDIPF